MAKSQWKESFNLPQFFPSPPPGPQYIFGLLTNQQPYNSSSYKTQQPGSLAATAGDRSGLELLKSPHAQDRIIIWHVWKVREKSLFLGLVCTDMTQCVLSAKRSILKAFVKNNHW